MPTVPPITKITNKNKKVLMAAADTFRAAAVEQLEIWTNRAGCDIVKKEDKDNEGNNILLTVEEPDKNVQNAISTAFEKVKDFIYEMIAETYYIDGNYAEAKKYYLLKSSFHSKEIDCLNKIYE